jgi:hypothetical protein
MCPTAWTPAEAAPMLGYYELPSSAVGLGPLLIMCAEGGGRGQPCSGGGRGEVPTSLVGYSAGHVKTFLLFPRLRERAPGHPIQFLVSCGLEFIPSLNLMDTSEKAKRISISR